MDKQRKSDEAFLNKWVYISSGELCGVTTIYDLIQKRGLVYFKTHFIVGSSDYRWTKNGRIEEVFREPIIILDAKSGKEVSGIGALRTYNRVHPFYSDWNWSYIPGTKRSVYRQFRRPKTFSVLRESCFYLKEEGEMPFSSKSRKLPTGWDDYGRSCNKDRSWKKFRKTQYKKPA